MLTTINVNAFSHSEEDQSDISYLGDDTPGLSHTATIFHASAVNGNKRLLQKLLQEVGTSDEINRGDQFGRTPLVYSVLGDRLDCAKLLILYGASVSLSDVDGRTPLHWAAYQGSQKCVKLLLSKGADWKAKDIKGRTPLHFAASHHSSKCLSVLLKKAPKGEVQVDNPDNDSMTALHWGASYGNAEHVKMLLRAKASVKLLDLEKKTPLHWATTNKNPSVVKLILEQTNDIINWQDIEGRTALHLAVARQNEAVVKTLLAIEKCNTSLQDNMGRTPLHWAAVLENSRIVQLLLRRNTDYTLVDGNGSTALHYAAQGDYSKTVEELLSFRHVKDTPDNEGRTALMWAAGKGASAALKVMLKYHLDVHETDNSGRTALHIAAYTGDLKCVEMLLENGASVNALDEHNHTPLFRACEMGYADVVNLLKQNKAILDLEDQDGRSPLHWAALNGHAHICLTLVTNGVQINRGDRLGCTPLHCAAYGGFVNCMSVLIDNGADVNKLDDEGISAFHWACSSGHLEAVKLLFRKKAFPNFKKLNGERLTPLDYAILGDHQDVAQYMIEQGGLTFRAIQDVAATTIQSCWRGYRVRKPFQKRKTLYMRHEQLKRDMKRRTSIAKEEELKASITESAMSSCQLDVEYTQPKPSIDSGRRQALCHSTSAEDGLFHLDLELLPEPSNMYYTNNVNVNDDDDDDDAFLVNNQGYFDSESDEEESYLLPTILEMSNPKEMIMSANSNRRDKTLSSRDCTVAIPEDQMESKVIQQVKTNPEAEQTREAKDQQKPEDIKASIYEMLVKQTPNSSSNINRSDHKPEKFAVSGESAEASKDKLKETSFKDDEPTKEHPKASYSKDNKEIVLRQQTSEIARKERKRRQLIRTKMNAATTIQRWYRKHRRVKQSEVSFHEMLIDQQDLVKHIAALTIQLCWRKYLCREYQRSTGVVTSCESRTHLKGLPKNNAPSTKPSKPKKKESSARAMEEPTTRLSRSAGLRALSASFAGNHRRTVPASQLPGNKDTRTSSTTRRGTSNKIRPISVPRISKPSSSQTHGPSSSRRRSKSAWKN